MTHDQIKELANVTEADRIVAREIINDWLEDSLEKSIDRTAAHRELGAREAWNKMIASLRPKSITENALGIFISYADAPELSDQLEREGTWK